MSNRKLMFINLLIKETKLSYEEAKNIISDLPEEYLDKAITQYYRGGLVKLKIFIVGIIRFNHIK